MYRRPVAGVYMKNFIRRLLGRFYAVNHSDVLSLSGLYDAVANELWGAGLQNKIDAMENEKAELISVLESAAPATASLHPALAALYKEKIANLRMF